MLQKGSIHALVYIPYLILDGRQNFAGQLIAQCHLGRGYGICTRSSGVGQMEEELVKKPTEEHREDECVWERRKERSSSPRRSQREVGHQNTQVLEAMMLRITIS